MEEAQTSDSVTPRSYVNITNTRRLAIIMAFISAIYFIEDHKVEKWETLYKIWEKYNNPQILTLLLNPEYRQKDYIHTGDQIRVLAHPDNINLHKIDETCYYNIHTWEYKIQVYNSLSWERHWEIWKVNEEVRYNLSELRKEDIIYEIRQDYYKKNNWM